MKMNMIGRATAHAIGEALGPARWGALVVVAITTAAITSLVLGPAGRSTTAPSSARPPATSEIATQPETAGLPVASAPRAGLGAQRGVVLSDRHANRVRVPRPPDRRPGGGTPPAGPEAAASQTSPFFPCQVDCFVVDTAAPVAGASVQLYRYSNRITTTVTSRGLAAGHVHTVWFMVFNAPQYCTANPTGPFRCGAQDVFNPLTQTSHMWGGSAVARSDGTLGALGAIDKGDRAVFLWEPGLLDTSKAEIAIVLRDHGLPNGASDQTTTMNGGCIQAAAMPGTGSIGPNSCENKQASMFPALA